MRKHNSWKPLFSVFFIISYHIPSAIFSQSVSPAHTQVELKLGLKYQKMSIGDHLRNCLPWFTLQIPILHVHLTQIHSFPDNISPSFISLQHQLKVQNLIKLGPDMDGIPQLQFLNYSSRVPIPSICRPVKLKRQFVCSPFSTSNTQ